MSTNSLIGTLTKDRFFGRYVHGDGYPTWMGPQLLRILARHDGDLAKMLDTLLHKHTQGWSYLTDNAEAPYDFVGPERSVFVPYVGMAYRETPGDTTPYTGRIGASWNGDGGASWGYFFTSTDLTTAELVVVYFDEKPEEVARIPLAQLHTLDRKAWEPIECGANFERCCHLAWAHLGKDKMPKGTDRLGMRTWLGLDPLTPDNAIGCIKDGKRYLFTGGGSLRGGIWYCSAKYTNGRRAPDVAFRTGMSWRAGVQYGGEILPGVEAIYPPVLTSATS